MHIILMFFCFIVFFFRRLGCFFVALFVLFCFYIMISVIFLRFEFGCVVFFVVYRFFMVFLKLCLCLVNVFGCGGD